MKAKNTFWHQRKVLVTGGCGFIGSFVVEKLLERKAVVTVLDRLTTGTLRYLEPHRGQIQVLQGDCTDLQAATAAAKGQSIVMNLAAHVGGIGYNRIHQATMLRDNLSIGMTMLEAARIAEVERFLVVSSACIYPHSVQVPTPETDGFLGEPEATNGGYGWAKRMAEKFGLYYAQEFGMKISIVRPYNAYGPRDNFASDEGHVIPSLIKRVLANEDPIQVWGTGNQTRAFLYVEDLAEGMIQAIERYPFPEAINLGTDEEVTIRELISLILQITHRSPKVLFDTTKPDGSPRRSSDNTLAKEKIGFRAQTSLREGLEKTIAWYQTIYQPTR
jgi:GDP-L-fucose synthase